MESEVPKYAHLCTRDCSNPQCLPLTPFLSPRLTTLPKFELLYNSLHISMPPETIHEASFGEPHLFVSACYKPTLSLLEFLMRIFLTAK